MVGGNGVAIIGSAARFPLPPAGGGINVGHQGVVFGEVVSDTLQGLVVANGQGLVNMIPGPQGVANGMVNSLVGML